MANPHFAKLGDVWKHLSLAELLRLKPPRCYWETHAGSPMYDLAESPARLHGAIGFVARGATDPDLATCEYMGMLRALPGRYPGSPAIAMRVLDRRARYVFCDLDPESVRDLRAASGGFDVQVVEGDGVAAISRMAAAGEQAAEDVLVHIDPFEPHERRSPDASTPIELAGSLARRGYRVFYWYGYDESNRRGWAWTEIVRLAPAAPLWCGDVLIPAPFVYPERRGAWGCGIVLANVSRAEADACARLGRALARVYADDVLADNEPKHLTFEVIDRQ